MNTIITNEIWESLYDQLDQKRKFSTDLVDVALFLAENNHPPIFDGIYFLEKQDLGKLIFKEILFVNCNFIKVTFNESRFEKLIIKNCSFTKPDWNQIILQNCILENCEFSGLRACQSGFTASILISSKFLYSQIQNSVLVDTTYIRCHFQETDVISSNIQSSFFSSCELSDTSWHKCKLSEVSILLGKLEGASFWKNTFQTFSFIESDLAECLMIENVGDPIIQNSTPPHTTRPVIAVSWDFNSRTNYAPLIVKALRENGAIPLKVEIEPDDISSELLHLEVAASISRLKDEYPTKILSIPSVMLYQASKDSEIGKIKSKIQAILPLCDGLALPGGSDLQPEFYGAERDPQTDNITDYRRSIVEFALLFYAEEANLPTMGTCRGSQLINVYFGGTLQQHVDNQYTRKEPQLVRLSTSSRKEEFLSFFGSDTLPSVSMHHQKIDKIGKNLEVICEFEGIPKLVLSPDNRYIASQIHPEVYVSLGRLPDNFKPAKCGELIYKLFLTKVAQHQNKL